MIRVPNQGTTRRLVGAIGADGGDGGADGGDVGGGGTTSAGGGVPVIGHVMPAISGRADVLVHVAMPPATDWVPCGT